MPSAAMSQMATGLGPGRQCLGPYASVPSLSGLTRRGLPLARPFREGPLSRLRAQEALGRRGGAARPRPFRAAAVRAAAAAADQQLVTVRFLVNRRIDFGRVHRIVGDLPALGAWDAGRGAQMAWSDGDRWTAEIAVPAGTTLEFKVVEQEGGGEGDGGAKAAWEPGCNHAIAIPDAGAEAIEVAVRWGSDVEINAVPLNGAAPAPAQQQQQWGGEDGDGAATSSGSFSSSGDEGSGGSMDGTLSGDDIPVSGQWAGREPVFMRSNEHGGRERRNRWRTEGLSGAALALVAGDRDAPSWLNKLELAKRLLVDDAPAWRPDGDALRYAYVYLTWVATGAVECVDAGGHRRPNHHADLGRLTFRSLEWVAGERAGGGDAVLARRLQTRLPSFAAEFTQSTPLTRIRDIAHRNDIPQALKAEIKHTIQNKLHRNAGPEDLVATQALLAKVTANPGEYPEAFIAEMRTFLGELRDFFNAGGLAEALGGISPGLDDAGGRLVERFLANKGALDAAGPGADDNMLMDALHGTASVRALLASGLASGLRNDAPDRALAMRQRWRMAEIKAEDYAFVLLSRFINALEARGGAAALAAGTDGTWGLPLGALVVALRHVGLCGFQPAECMAIERELATWQRLGGLTHREEALRLRATLQRAQRLADAYCQLLLDALAGPAATLGAALGVEPERAAVFAESEIRAAVVFQLSKLASLLQRATTMVAQTTPWDVIMSGTAAGVLIEAPALEPGCLAAAAGADAIVVVTAATGDEEVGALGPNLKGVVLRHMVPHLSHLGVRARQEGVPFVACDDDAAVEGALRNLVGTKVVMTSEVDSVAFEPYDAAKHRGIGAAAAAAAAAGPSGNGAAAAAAGAVVKASRVGFLPLEAATVETCGAKAAACGALLILGGECAAAVQTSGRGDGAPLFEAANGVVMPFGSLEAALAADGKAEAYARAVEAASAAAAAAAPAAQLDALAADVAAVIASVRIPQTIVLTMGGAFDPGTTVIVRSSANVEDLEGMSGAGLYESVPNVDPRDPAALQAAIAGVWSSLHTRRALLARAAAGVPAAAADMAVVVQRQLAPELSFVLHTAHPLTRDASVLVAEVAPGMGETLASGTSGSAWRLEVDRDTGGVRTLAFANFSQALMPTKRSAYSTSFSESATASASASGDALGGATSSQEVEAAAAEAAGLSLATAAALSGAASAAGTVAPAVVDYSAQELSWSEEARTALGRRLVAVGRLLESEFEGPQDVEGCVVEGRFFVVQTRPQP